MNLPILLINLAESKNRLEHSQKELARFGLSFVRLEAVDGRKMSAPEMRQFSAWDRTAFFKPLSPGEVGCYLSHLNAAKRIVSEGWPWTLVLEDDFKLSDDFLQGLIIISKADLSPYHIIKIEGRMYGGEVVQSLDRNLSVIRNRRPPSCTIAQIWSLAGAKRFLEKSTSLKRPVDVQLKHWWEMNLNIVHLDPPLVFDADADGATSIIGRRKLKGLIPWVRRMRYKIKFTLSSHFHYLRRWGLASWVRSMAVR